MPAPVVRSGAVATVVAASVGGVVAAEVVGTAVEGGVEGCVVAAMVVGGARLVASEMLDTGTPLLHDVSPSKAATTNDALNDDCLALPTRRP